MDRTESQAGSGDETLIPRPGTAASVRSTTTKPTTRPITSARLINLAKPKEVSTTKTDTTSLSRPPSRPTAARKPTNTATPSSTTPKPYSSVPSADSKTSGDESKRDVISTRPKRMSVTSTPIAADRSSNSRPPAPVPVKRSLTATSATSRGGSYSPTNTRASVKSPATTSTTTTLSTARSTPSLASRTKPAAPARTATTTSDKKRLSTIPASPAETSGRKNVSTEAGLVSGKDSPSASRTRPTLGSRKSTRSLLVEQQIREVELVNRMLQAAMQAEDTDVDEQEALEQQATDTMVKLRSTLTKVRQFEKQHGRPPSEAELADISSDDTDADQPLIDLDEARLSTSVTVPGGHTLRDELAESRAYASQLEYQLEDMTAKLKLYSENANSEGNKADDTAEASRTDHANKMREMSSANQARLDHLRAIHREELEELRAQHEAETALLRQTQETGNTEKDSELLELKTQVKDLTSENAKIAEKEQELDTLRNEVDALNAKVEEGESKARMLSALQAELEQARKNTVDIAEKDTEISQLQTELENAKKRTLDIIEKDAEISRLQVELEYEKAKPDTHEKDVEINKLKVEIQKGRNAASGTQEKDAEIASLRAQVEALSAKVEPRKVEPVKDLPETSVPVNENPSPIKSKTQVVELQKKLEAMQTRHQAAKENAKSKAARAEEEHMAKLAGAMKAHDTVLAESRAQIEQLQTDLAGKQADLENLRSSHEQELAELRTDIGVHVKEIAKLQETIAASKEQEARLTESVSTIEQLREQISETRDALEEHKKSAAATLVAVREEHTKLLEVSQAQLESVQAGFEQSKALDEQKANEAINNLTYDLARARKELNNVRNSHEENIQNLQRDLNVALTANKEAESEYAAKLEQADKAAEEALRLHEKTKTDLEIQLDTAQTRLSEVEANLVTLKITHDNDLADTTNKLMESHEKVITDLKTSHADQLKQLEDDTRASLTSLNEIERAHGTRILELQTEAAATKESALKQQRESHSVIAKELESELRALQEQLADVKSSHDSVLKDLETTHASDKESALKKLQDQHTSKIAELESQPKGVPVAELDNLKQNHAEQIRELEAKNKALMSQAEGFHFQLQTMKSIMADTEAESRTKEQEHADAIQQAEDQFSQAVMRIANQSSALVAKDAEYNEVLNKTRAEMQEQHDKVLEDTKAQHDVALAELNSKLESQTAELQEDLRAEHAHILENLKEELAAKDVDIEKIKADHAKALRSLQTTSEGATKDIIEQMKAEHLGQLDALKAELEATHQTALIAAAADHKVAMDKNNDAMTARLEALRIEHEEALSKVQVELEAAEVAAADSTALDKANTDLVAAREAIIKIRQEHDSALKNIRSDHKEAIAKLEVQIAGLEAIVDQPNDTAIEDGLKAELAKAEASFASLTAEHEKVLNMTRAEHVETLAALRAELDQARSEIHPDRTSEVADLESMIGEATKTNATLSANIAALEETQASINQKCEAAAQEATFYRKRAEQVEKEIQELRKRTPVATSTRPGPTHSVSASKLQNAIHLKSPKSPAKTGLASSKWAADDADNGKENQDPRSPSRVTGLGMINEDGLENNRSATSRNVHGQLAGIKEDIRALHDLSERMLAENRRMARTLSRVNDDTGIVSVEEVVER